jgi:predicted PurR-regulated permease PerM
VHVTAPDAVEHLFGGADFEAIDRLIERAPLPSSARPILEHRIDAAIAYIRQEAKNTLTALIDAAQYAAWLAVTPVLAFLLLTTLPSFRRSTLRVLPRASAVAG